MSEIPQPIAMRALELATVSTLSMTVFLTFYEQGIAAGRAEAAAMADREGHSWSGAPATSFFQLAERLRGPLSPDVAKGADE